MTYPIANVVYGIPQTKEILDIVIPSDDPNFEDCAGEKIRDVDDLIYGDPDHNPPGFGFVSLYSAGPDGDDTAGYFGVELWSDAYWELKTQLADLKPTDEQIEEVNNRLAKLPEWFRSKLPEPSVQIVWSDS